MREDIMIHLSNSTKRLIFLTTAILSTVLLAVSLAIHIATFWTINIAESFPTVYILPFFFFFLYVPFLVINHIEKKELDEEMITLGVNLKEPLRQPTEVTDNTEVKTSSKWFGAYIILGIYVTINFFAFAMADGDKRVERIGDEYVMKNRATYVRHITVDEYDYYSARTLHGITGHCLAFYFYFAVLGFQASRKYKDMK